jgi:hypothetical protein
VSTLEDKQFLLLDMLSPVRVIDKNLFLSMELPDWQFILRLAYAHRLEPLLHWQLQRHHTYLELPDLLANSLKISFKRSTMRSLELQRELLLVCQILDAKKIPYVALKGAYLALHTYPQSGLRPLRDLDILVPFDCALTAYQALLDAGLKRQVQYPGYPLASMQVHTHLPPILSKSERVNIELHAHLLHPEIVLPNSMYGCDIWNRTIEKSVGNAMIRFLSPTDLLLHLIVHAIYMHRFNNGPLVISDIAFLLKTSQIDWSLFWKEANTGCWAKGCFLTLKIVEKYWGALAIDWPDDHLSIVTSLEDMIKEATLLMLGNYDGLSEAGFATEIMLSTSPAVKMRLIMRELFRSRLRMSAASGIPALSPYIYLEYFKLWKRVIVRRLPAILHLYKQTNIPVELSRWSRLQRWLHS